MSREWTKNPQKLEILLQNFADIIWEYDTQAKDLYPETECAQRFGLFTLLFIFSFMAFLF